MWPFTILLDYMVDKKLEEWKVDMYANNTYLHKIPNSRIIEKREEIRKEILDKLFFWIPI